MSPENQQSDFGRPSARPVLSAMPVQRGNYGIPPRQASAAPVGPRMMDVAAPPPRPAAPPVQVATPAMAQPMPTVQATPVATQVPAAPVAQPIITTPKEPVFSATRARSETKSPLPGKFKRLLGRAGMPLLIIGGALLIGGVVRVITAGNISGYTVAVGAVTANDGHKTSVQFTADDGLLHHFSFKGSSRTQTPGAALQVAYQPGAADATVRQVAVVNKAHNLGIVLVAIGGVTLASGVIITLVKRSHRRPKAAAPQSAPATA